MSKSRIPLGYDSSPSSHAMPWREYVLLACYHLRLLNWWLYALMLLGFLGSCAIFWLQIRTGTIESIHQGDSLSRFILETGAGLISGALASTLVIGDPLLEISMATRTGILRILLWRYLLTCLTLFVCSVAYLGWTLHFGATYTQQQSPLSLLLVWLAPVALLSMLSMLGAFFTCNATLGATLSIIPLVADVFLHDELLSIAAMRPIFIPYTYWAHDAPDWWVNRLTLLGIAGTLALCSWWRLRHEEHLLSDAR
ncbi:hypothetical protein [Ktedonospora formicarum]|uniref:ABC transporter permease n=1 Tax=Ktedonospora formicarum TaxID=2778364 RepID=A0A8J3I1Y3_9CHLR|nr:hypothetical protein [Ktedonospora formicarum]GHO47834.1 hypothetical protein KSX_59970 [Ktedonospora formicarum]